MNGSETLDVLAFGAHPDDVEIGMGGTVAKHAAAGDKVGICDLTYAELSSNGTPLLRQQEAAAAAEVLGIAVRSNLGMPDRGLTGEAAQVSAIVRELRLRRPRIVFAPYWHDRHPDHVRCSQLVQEALFNAKLRKYLPELPAWNVEHVYYYFINDVYEADVMVDVSAVYEQKLASLRAYRSQFDATGPDSVRTPLNQGYVERVEARDRLLGQKRLVPYAEGFVSKLPLLVEKF
ncbi:deacetylase [Gordoniibacillus kamchatkensis]|uniref:Deacetylase n=1 Tax=Gordoniibacillus kamchatkensis TaxID=1590651 RepID=A0ABR5AMI9_9BACL|nr:bacillithiol biosynthesis deacetylase BshB1 [Paenibacillus sp. VKM B-2647]KIL41577.1 deacetylase [Paenibacillus sp. VKM B-2647]